ncbi:hypothetical protein G4B88_012561 [Cannabis sativa]|uniref:FPL domain-containing protein n=1 Tax=Cannabis sativa TaxID=3483 RepID=A0A7J6E2P4_CANSA|nr:hypothetical protein G4B88_012561 [Cannabis sativa]
MLDGVNFVGGALGLAMGLFIGSLDNPITRDEMSGKQQFVYQAKQMGRRSWSSAKAFAVMGFVFSAAECVIEKARAKHDTTNTVVAGCVTGGTISAKEMHITFTAKFLRSKTRSSSSSSTPLLRSPCGSLSFARSTDFPSKTSMILRYVVNELREIKVVDEHNKESVVDLLQSVVEIVTYGDKQDPMIFEYFMECQVLAEFLRVLKISRDSRIEIPLLQYLSIMIQNMDNYCFSNDYINNIIEHQYQFNRGDLAQYYVSFLRISVNCLLSLDDGVMVGGVLANIDSVSREMVVAEAEALKPGRFGNGKGWKVVVRRNHNVHSILDSPKLESHSQIDQLLRSMRR